LRVGSSASWSGGRPPKRNNREKNREWPKRWKKRSPTLKMPSKLETKMIREADARLRKD